MSRYLNILKKNFNQPEEEKYTQDQTKIFTGIVHCNGVDITMEYDYKEFDERYNKPIHSLVLEEREQLPPSPYSTFKDDNKNEHMNWKYRDGMRIGLFDTPQYELAFRVAQVRLTRKVSAYPYNFTQKTKGFLYDDTFLDIMPSLFATEFKPKLAEGYKMVIIKKFPVMLHKDYFRIIQTFNPQMEMRF